MRPWATVLLVLCVPFVLVGLIVMVVGEDPAMGAAGVLFFGGGVIVAAVMRLEASKGSTVLNVVMNLGRTPARTAALLISSFSWAGAGALIVFSPDQDPLTGWITMAFGVTCALMFAARLIDQERSVAHPSQAAPSRAPRVLGLLGCAGFVVVSVLILMSGGPPWIGGSGIVVFGGILVIVAVRALRRGGPSPARRPNGGA